MSSTIAKHHTVRATLFAEPTFGNPLKIVGLWVARSKQRRALAALDNDRLTDLGITPMQAMIEAGKPFWVK